MAAEELVKAEEIFTAYFSGEPTQSEAAKK
jgi:hypothetical protein